MTTEQYDRLSILYADAHKALAEALEIAALAEDNILFLNNDATVKQAEFLCQRIDRFAPHSVRA